MDREGEVVEFPGEGAPRAARPPQGVAIAIVVMRGLGRLFQAAAAIAILLLAAVGLLSLLGR